ncbi:GNAT family N-acetyltransferase [Rhizobium sp. RAF56]|uniref:GNAT family N-acetyltransferase n=1 Tax=Rhizobium sp. RAF56 TaxID=3233062 RepID=UPI003F98B051
MSRFDVRLYDPSVEARWDEWCASAVNATILHTRRFLSYHGDRFKDMSLLIFDAERLVGVFPAAIARDETDLVVSHPGATYGGVVHDGRLTGERMLATLEDIAAFYQSRGFSRLLYKALPHCYATVPAQDDLYALFRLNARRTRCDLSSAIDLSNRRPLGDRRRRSLKKAQNAVSISGEIALLPELWNVLEGNLARKHAARPVHSLEEITLLAERFPDHIRIGCATAGNDVVAGILMFLSANVWHVQYIASSEMGYALSALDAVFDAAIEGALGQGIRYFDFGISNEEGGRVLNESLYRFKTEFGGGGMVHEFYEIPLPRGG